MPIVAAGARPGGVANFTYREFPGWDTATRAQLDGLDLLAETILQPVRDGARLRIYPTSWLRPRQGSSIHPLGAAIDFAAGPLEGGPPTWEHTYRAWLWLAQNIPDRVGELILEQPKTGVTGHVHATLPGYGGRSEIMYQAADGRLLLLDPFSLAVSASLPPGRPGEPGSETNPYELEGIVVTVSRWPWLPWALGGLGLLALLRASRRGG